MCLVLSSGQKQVFGVSHHTVVVPSLTQYIKESEREAVLLVCIVMCQYIKPATGGSKTTLMSS